MTTIVKEKPMLGLNVADCDNKTLVYIDEHGEFTGKDTQLSIENDDILITEGPLVHQLKNILPEIINKLKFEKYFIVNNKDNSIPLYLK